MRVRKATLQYVAANCPKDPEKGGILACPPERCFAPFGRPNLFLGKQSEKVKKGRQ